MLRILISLLRYIQEKELEFQKVLALKKKKIYLELNNIECGCCGKKFKPEPNASFCDWYSCSGGVPPDMKVFYYCSEKCWYQLTDLLNKE